MRTIEYTLPNAVRSEMVELGTTQPDGVEGLAEFREHHMAMCGYSP